MITPKITNLGYSNLWTDMSTILGYASNSQKPITKLFANGEQGFAYDPNDLTTLYQDATGTIPVTAAGQPVGLMKDKSGRNNHASQTVSASRPILQRNATTGAYYLAFDGVDDFLVIAKDNLKFLHDGTGSSVFIGYTPLSSTYHTLMTSGYLANTSNIGYTLSQDDRSGSGAVLNIITNGSGTSTVVNNVGATGITNKPRVVTTKNKVGTHIIRHNALQILNNPTETGIASTAQSSQDLRIGNSAAGFPLTGHIYSLIGIGRLTTDTETLALEKAIAKATGVTLNV